MLIWTEAEKKRLVEKVADPSFPIPPIVRRLVGELHRYPHELVLYVHCWALAGLLARMNLTTEDAAAVLSAIQARMKKETAGIVVTG